VLTRQRTPKSGRSGTQAGRRSYSDTTISTTLAPCWLCSGLIRQFAISTVVVGGVAHVSGRDRLAPECGVHVIDCESDECIALLRSFIADQPETWGEDIGE
jgi:cytosine/creatinine deaminase